MERLIFSSSPVPSKIYLKPHPGVPQHVPVQPRKLGSLRVNSFSFNPAQFQFRAACFSKSSDSALSNSSPNLSSSNGSPLDSCSVKQQAKSDSLQRVIATGKIVLLSLVTMILLNPVLPFPVKASLPTATNTGATVGKGLFRSEILTSAWTGFFAGCLHTLSGPDHLAALAPLSIGRSKMESALVGALWGCGHDAGQVIFGLLFLLLKDRLHIEVIRTWGTRVVGLTLLVIGAMGIKEASEVPTPCVALENGECHVDVYETLDGTLIGGNKKKKIGFATFATGIVHGLQPDALMMVLPALALPSRVAGAAFLCMFLVGTVVAMGGYTVFIGSCSEALKKRVPRITEKLTWASSLIAIGLGFAILISQFFGFSLY